MIARALLFMSLLLALILAAACTTPPPTTEQLEAYARYAALRATDAAAGEIIAAAKATEAAAAEQIARLTVEAAAPTAIVTTTAAITPSLTMTATPAITATAAITVAPSLLATPAITLTASITTTPVMTSTAVITPGLQAAGSMTPTLEVVLSPTFTATPTAPPTATLTPTATPSPSVTPTPSQPPTATPSSTATASATAAAGPTTATATATAAAALSPTATPTPAAVAVVRSQRINLRGGPGTEFDVLGSAAQGQRLAVLGSNADATWWQVCCAGDRPGWASSSVVTVQGDAQAIPVVTPLMPDDLAATWAVRWECHAEGCKQEECLGQSQAQTLRARTPRWLEVKREATWQSDCGEREEWLTEVDRYTGQERPASSNPPLFAIWAGANPGPESKRIDLLERTLSLWCTETRTQETPQSDGWTVLFEGQACYDRAAGVLATLQYTKRWLFSGEFGGQTYERQYFGDYEVYQQVLTSANAPLSSLP